MAPKGPLSTLSLWLNALLSCLGSAQRWEMLSVMGFGFIFIILLSISASTPSGPILTTEPAFLAGLPTLLAQPESLCRLPSTLEQGRKPLMGVWGLVLNVSTTSTCKRCEGFLVMRDVHHFPKLSWRWLLLQFSTTVGFYAPPPSNFSCDCMLNLVYFIEVLCLEAWQAVHNLLPLIKECSFPLFV